MFVVFLLSIIRTQIYIFNWNCEIARRRLSTRKRITGMKNGGMSCCDIGRRLECHYIVIARLIQKQAKTNDITDRSWSGRPKATSVREDRNLLWLFTSTPTVRNQWNTTRWRSIQTVRNRPKAAKYRASRSLKRRQLTDRHIRDRLIWCRDLVDWNMASRRRIHWSEENTIAG